MREFTDINALPWPELRDLQLAELENLLVFDEVCKKNNIRYTLGGGTCIGAMREGGFIVWDDDIDVWVPRPDYIRLHEIWDEEVPDKHFKLCRNSDTENYHINCSFVKNEQTTFINRHSINEDVIHGISIDVMPMDGAPASALARFDQIICSAIFCLYGAQRLPDHQGKVIRELSRLPLAIIRKPSTRYKIWKHFEKRMTRWDWDSCPYAKELCTGFHMKLKKMPREWFDSCKPITFEGHEVLIAQGAENYMTMLFGDYMTPPSNDSDKGPKHNIVYVNLDKPYKDFKGKYYCIEDQ